MNRSTFSVCPAWGRFSLCVLIGIGLVVVSVLLVGKVHAVEASGLVEDGAIAAALGVTSASLTTMPDLHFRSEVPGGTRAGAISTSHAARIDLSANAAAKIALSIAPEPFTITVQPDFEVNGQGSNVDSIAFWEAHYPVTDTLMFVTAKGNQLVEVWQYPFVDNELDPLTHSSFGSDTNVNGVAVDQAQDRLYVSVSEPASTVSFFSIPQLQYVGEFIEGAVNLRSEPNVTLLKHTNGQTWLYVSANNVVYIHDAETGTEVGQFNPVKGLETMMADDLYQVIYIPDENDRTGIYAYNPDGTPYEQGDTNNFGGGVFQADAEGIVLFTCPSDGESDNGSGLIVVADQKSDQTDFEFFDRQTWEYLGTLRIEGVSNTDGIGSTQRSLPDYPLGLFAAINDDTSTVGVGWDKIFDATGLNCGALASPPIIRAFTPTSGPIGTEVTITGSGFISVTGVAISGTAVLSYTVDSVIQIRAVVPVGATTGPISVTNPIGTGLSADDFTVTDGLPSVQFDRSSYSVGEGSDQAAIIVTLSHPSAFEVTVGYATTDGTALAGDDYVAASGTLAFTAGVTSQAFTVMIIEDELDEDGETVDLSLSGPPTNATLGTPSKATLTIKDSFDIYLPLILRNQ